MEDYRNLNFVDQFERDDHLYDDFHSRDSWLKTKYYKIDTPLILMHEGILCSRCHRYKYECECKK